MAEASPTRLDCQVVTLDRATHDIRILRLAPPPGARLQFRAGQYARLSFGDRPARDFSMANRPDEPVLEFHVRQMNDEGASGYVAHSLNPGDRVGLEGPFGDAWLREEHSGPILALAGGSGLAPIKSIVETALHKGMQQEIHLYFGARAERDLYLVERFQRLAEERSDLRYVPLLSDPEEPGACRRGLLHGAIAADFHDLGGAKAYLAGPPAMVEAAVDALRERGLPETDIHADPFISEAEKVAREQA